jgi:hypothetical protein
MGMDGKSMSIPPRYLDLMKAAATDTKKIIPIPDSPDSISTS